MKKLIIITAIIIFGISNYSNAANDYAKRVDGYFYTSLRTHGTWIDVGFGTPVWRPTIIRKNWSPYYYGQWVYTNYGWYWDSYEPFGFIVYHYGRWYYDDYYGWIWIPDYEWAPAWVDWRYDDDYVGWAPLSPYAVFYINIGIHYTYDYYVPYNHWNYVKYNRFCENNVYNYYVAPKYKHRVYNRTKVRTNYSYYDGRVRNNGVEFDRIREKVGRKIEKRNLVAVKDPNELNRQRNGNIKEREIRTYFADERDLSRDGLRDVKIEKSDRKSSLEMSRIELGKERTTDRINERKVEENRKLEKERTVEVNRNNTDRTRNDINKNRVEDEKRLQEKEKIEKRFSEIENRNNEVTKRNDAIIRNEQIKRNQDNNREERTVNNNQNEVRKEDKRSNTEVIIQNTDRKVEQKIETRVNENRNRVNSNTNRDTDVRKNESGNRNETKNNTRESVNNNKTRSR